MSEELHRQGPAIDRAHLDRMTGGDSELALEVLGLVREQASMWQRLLSPDTETDDWAVAVHTIKGSARGIGAWELGELCGAAEEAARSGPMTRDDKRSRGDAILAELDRVTGEMARIEHQIALRGLRS